MIIDIHTHITYQRFPEFSTFMRRQPFTARTLLKRMDLEGIDRSVVLPLANPENMDILGVADNPDCLEACRKHPDRLIPFCNVDPRAVYNSATADFGPLLRIYKELGCRGIGEVCANLPITDPRCQNLFHHAGEEKLPVLMHFADREGGVYGLVDDLHLPGLEQALRDFPKTVFIGHAMSFWSEIDGDVTAASRGGYPKGAIRTEGRLWTLLETYPNLYGDLSAGSGFNAVSRDPQAGYRFMQRLNRKLFFGTDRFTSPKEPIPPILGYLKDALANRKLTKAAYENIMHRNYERVFRAG